MRTQKQLIGSLACSFEKPCNYPHKNSPTRTIDCNYDVYHCRKLLYQICAWFRNGSEDTATKRI